MHLVHCLVGLFRRLTEWSFYNLALHRPHSFILLLRFWKLELWKTRKYDIFQTLAFWGKFSSCSSHNLTIPDMILIGPSTRPATIFPSPWCSPPSLLHFLLLLKNIFSFSKYFLPFLSLPFFSSAKKNPSPNIFLPFILRFSSPPKKIPSPNIFLSVFLLFQKNPSLNIYSSLSLFVYLLHRKEISSQNIFFLILLCFSSPLSAKNVLSFQIFSSFPSPSLLREIECKLSISHVILSNINYQLADRCSPIWSSLESTCACVAVGRQTRQMDQREHCNPND